MEGVVKVTAKDSGEEKLENTQPACRKILFQKKNTLSLF